MAGISRSGDAAPVWLSDENGNVLGGAANPLNVSGGGGGGGGGVVTQPTASQLNAQVQGNSASSATDTGNPVKVAARYNATIPTVTDGQRVDLQADTRGTLNVALYGRNTASAVVVGTVVDASSAGNVALTTIAQNLVLNPGGTYDRMRGDTTGTYMTQRPTAGINLSGTATTTSGGFSIPANATRHPGDVQGQNVSAVNIGFNEFGGTAAIGAAGTYTVPPGGTFVITTTAQVNFIAASGTAAITITAV